MKTLDEFYEHLEYQKQFRPVTIGNYKRVLNKIFKDLGTFTISQEQGGEWILTMQKRKLSASHINNTAAILTRYTSFVNGGIELIRMKKPKPLIKDTLTEGEIARILAACSSSREKAIVALLAYSGIRANELCNLTVKDLDLDNGIVQVIDGKGGKDGVSYIPRECCKMISEYLGEYPTNPHLFKTLQQKNKYTTYALRKMVKKVSVIAGIKKRVFPHLFRHSLATNLIKRGADITTVQQQLRHSSPTTTQIYIRSFPERVQDTYAFYKPQYI